MWYTTTRHVGVCRKCGFETEAYETQIEAADTIETHQEGCNGG